MRSAQFRRTSGYGSTLRTFFRSGRVVGRWKGLSEEERWCFWEIMQQAPSSFSRLDLECDADILVGAGLLQFLKKKPEMLRLTPDGDNLRRLLNDLDKLMTPLDGAKGIEQMTDYVRSLLSMDERRKLIESVFLIFSSSVPVPSKSMKNRRIRIQVEGQPRNHAGEL